MSNRSLRPYLPDELYNGYLGASVAFAYHQLGVLSALAPGARRSADDLAGQTGADPRKLRALLKVGVALGSLDQDDGGAYGVTSAGEDLRRWLGYFTWSVGGYGEMLRRLAPLSRGEVEWSGMRDSGLVAAGTDHNSRMLMQEPLWEALDALSFQVIADLGCGNAGRLVQCCERYPHVRGVGIDISNTAISMATELVARQGLEDRIRLICADVLAAMEAESSRGALAGVEVVTSFMMLHDLFNVPELQGKVLSRVRAAFPDLRYIVVADTPSMPPLEELEKVPIFNLGYELLHEFMGVTLPPLSAYEDEIDRAGLTVERRLDFGSPFTYLWVLKV